MAKISLAVKYRPKTFDDVVEQDAIKIILTEQIKTESFKHAYLFCGPAGCGKTTAARIFANELNKGMGNPIEVDAASNNGVDNIREIIDNAKRKSLDSEYKIYIIDECHMLSTGAWNAMLKLRLPSSHWMYSSTERSVRAAISSTVSPVISRSSRIRPAISLILYVIPVKFCSILHLMER